MRCLSAPAKLNLALVVGPVGAGQKHEVATVLERLSLADRVALAPGDSLTVSGFDDDTLVSEALAALATASGVDPAWHVEIDKAIPVAAGLGGGSSDAAAALRLANESLPRPLPKAELFALAATVGADVPFFLASGPQLGTGDGTVLAPLALPTDYSVVLLMPANIAKESTRAVYRAFDARNGGEGFAARRAELLEALSGARSALDLSRLPPNDLASSPLSEHLRDAGAFRADVTGAGPCVYGLFSDRPMAEEAARMFGAYGRTWVTAPARESRPNRLGHASADLGEAALTGNGVENDRIARGADRDLCAGLR